MSGYDYGRCHICGAPVEERLRDHSIQADNEWLLIRSVPTGVCTKCGEQTFRLEVAQRIEEILNKRAQEAPTGRIEVPVFSY